MTSRRIFCLLSILILQVERPVSSSKILAVNLTPFYAHQAAFRPLWKALAAHGHEVTVLTTHPEGGFEDANITEVDVSIVDEYYQKFKIRELMCDDKKNLMWYAGLIQEAFKDAIHAVHKLPQYQEILNKRRGSYDIMIIELLSPFALGLAWRLQCPFIGIVSFEAPLSVHYYMGNPTHPVLVPDYSLAFQDGDDLTFMERVYQVLFSCISVVAVEYFLLPMYHREAKTYYGADLPEIQELIKNMSMLFINTSPITHVPRPVNPNTLLIGNGIHIQPPKALPEDIQKHLDEATDGAIFFSLGSNVKSHMMKPGSVQEILNAFRGLPYNVLWKFDDDNLKDVPTNVLIKKWFPQQDVLRHANIKLFITQGGLQSLEESLTFHVPMVGIPFYGDQIHNIRKMVKKGAGVELPRNDISEATLRKAILEVIGNPSYKEKAEELGRLLHDRPMTGVEEAVWWTEYVIRHKGAKYLKNTNAINIPLYKYFLLDVISFFILIISAVVFIVYKIIKYILLKLRSKLSAKVKVN